MKWFIPVPCASFRLCLLAKLAGSPVLNQSLTQGLRTVKGGGMGRDEEASGEKGQELQGRLGGKGHHHCGMPG